MAQDLTSWPKTSQLRPQDLSSPSWHQELPSQPKMSLLWEVLEPKVGLGRVGSSFSTSALAKTRTFRNYVFYFKVVIFSIQHSQNHWKWYIFIKNTQNHWKYTKSITVVLQLYYSCNCNTIVIQFSAFSAVLGILWLKMNN